ncbi:MAG: HAMP domain-containing histidine kinase [Granulosicoccus sp.]|nr:HAMP domain-containing histidine kinase [Granulosicoccus sp.]
MQTLFARLSLLFTGILICVGSMAWLIAHYSQQHYFDESNQQLSRPVAMYIATQVPLFVNGLPDSEALEALATHVMMINPSLEVYLLDEEGKVLATAVPDSQAVNRRVDVHPIQQFLSTNARLPVYGDNPAVPGEKRVFTAFPIRDAAAQETACDPCGYVYAVLGGVHGQSMWQSMLDSYSVRSSAFMLSGVLAFALVAGIAVFFMLTRPLRKLTRTMSHWQLTSPRMTSDVLSPLRNQTEISGSDELQSLAHTCQRMAARLISQYDALDKADRRRREFMTSVSHDLRTPLTGLCGAVETLLSKRGKLNVEQELQYLLLAQRQGQRLQHLIAQVFELARLDSGDVHLQVESICLPELLMDTLQDLQSRAHAAGVSLELVIEESAKGITVNADMTLLHRVLDNLLVNAIRHTPENGTVMVHVQLRSIDQVELTISDTGCGFARILHNCPLPVTPLDPDRSGDSGPVPPDEFTIAPDDRRGNGWQGTGLGLGIVARILALHGSVARICSEPGMGTRVDFSLPLARTFHDQLQSGWPGPGD